MVDKVVCERRCVTKLYVKGVLQLLVGPKRPKQNDKNNMMKVCMQETESVMSGLHSIAEAQLSPASRPRARTASLHANDQFHLPSAISATPAT